MEGVVVIERQPVVDERGAFARTWCSDEFAQQGLDVVVRQANLSSNACRGTLRGMHLAVAPARESKVVWCTRGSIYDVVVDLRRDSPTRFEWIGVELSRTNGRAIHVPVGCAHGFITLDDDTDVEYLMGDVFRPDLQRGFRWNDTLVGIEWPLEPLVISERDASLPDALAVAASD